MDDVEGRQVVEDAALVRRSRREIDAAIAELAARPLDEAAAERMRQVLDGSHSSARRALRRLRLAEDTPSATAGGAGGDVGDAPAQDLEVSPGQAEPARRQPGEECA